jgi:hypothetical protein
METGRFCGFIQKKGFGIVVDGVENLNINTSTGQVVSRGVCYYCKIPLTIIEEKDQWKIYCNACKH